MTLRRHSLYSAASPSHHLSTPSMTSFPVSISIALPCTAFPQHRIVNQGDAVSMALHPPATLYCKHTHFSLLV